jgi:hypothetical protein
MKRKETETETRPEMRTKRNESPEGLGGRLVEKLPAVMVKLVVKSEGRRNCYVWRSHFIYRPYTKKHVHIQTVFEIKWTDLTGNYMNDV